jgi:hypothetical protein
MRRLALFVGMFVLIGVVPAVAQPKQPLPVAVLDVRAFYSGFGQDPDTAADLVLTPDNLPKRGLGGVLGLHFYPLRRQSFALGIGGEGMLARATAQETDDEGVATGPRVEQRIQSLTPQISLNFGHRQGWSYLSAGMGPMTFATFLGTQPPVGLLPSKMVINMGGGARWFPKRHVAFCFDVRFYLTRPEVQTPQYPGRARNRLVFLSGGIAFK